MDSHTAANDKDFADIAHLAAAVMDAPVGFVSVVQKDRQIFLGSSGSDLHEIPIDDAICAFTIAENGEAMIVTDLQCDSRFDGNRLVRDRPNIRFYAGATIAVGGQKVGTVCVFDYKKRDDPGADQIEQLRKLAGLSSSLLEMKDNAQRRYEVDVARRRAEFRHSLALRAATIASWMWNIKSNLVSTDDTLREWVDLDFSGALTMQNLLTIVHPDDMEDVRVALDMAMGEDVDFHCEFRVGSVGKWLMGQGRVYERDSDGNALSMAGVFVDITETKRTEQTTRLLLRELNHRVKNTLAMLQSLAAQTMKTAPSPDQFMRAFSGRLQALAAAHTLLSDNKWHKVSLQTLLRSLVTPYAMRFEENVEISGDDVMIGPDEGLGLGLVVHELATNAARHGALSSANGKVRISMRVESQNGQDILILKWVETGGPPVTEPDFKGLGSILIERGMQKILKSHVETQFDPDGLIARVHFPLPQDPKE